MGSPDRWGGKVPWTHAGAQVPVHLFALPSLKRRPSFSGTTASFVSHDFAHLLVPQHFSISFVLLRLSALCNPLTGSVYPSLMNSASCWFLTKTRFIACCIDIYFFLRISFRPSCYSPSEANICLFVFVYVILQLELRPYNMPGKDLAAELHFSPKHLRSDWDGFKVPDTAQLLWVG